MIGILDFQEFDKKNTAMKWECWIYCKSFVPKDFLEFYFDLI